jgi:hypothetical protein
MADADFSGERASERQDLRHPSNAAEDSGASVALATEISAFPKFGAHFSCPRSETTLEP